MGIFGMVWWIIKALIALAIVYYGLIFLLVLIAI